MLEKLGIWQWWARQGLNLRPHPCEGSSTAPNAQFAPTGSGTEHDSMANKAKQPDHPLATYAERKVGRANRNASLRTRSWVYFARERGGGLIKIGRSRQVHRRMASLNAATPRGVILLGCIPETWLSEKSALARFAGHRVHGEWFEPVPSLLLLAEAGKRVFASGYTDTTDDDEAWAIIRGLSAQSVRPTFPLSCEAGRCAVPNMEGEG